MACNVVPETAFAATDVERCCAAGMMMPASAGD
jgi:hypothetical protein